MENIWEKGYRGVGKKKILSNGETSLEKKFKIPLPVYTIDVLMLNTCIQF